MERTIAAHALEAVVTDRIAELWRYRRWIRHQPNAAFWSPLRVEYEVELRALLRLRRKARQQAAEALARDLAEVEALFAGDHYFRTAS